MSHLATVDIQISDLSTLRTALGRFNLELQEPGQVRWYSGVQPADFVVKLPGRYDVGFTYDPEHQRYSVVADSEVLATHQYSLAKEAHQILGPGLGYLKREYGVAAASALYRRRGYRVQEHREKDTVRLTVSR